MNFIAVKKELKMRYRRLVVTTAFSAIAFTSSAQIAVDTTAGNVVVTEKNGTTTKTLHMYRTFVPGKGRMHRLIYQPDAANFGEESPTLHLAFNAESAYIRSMLDAAMKKKQLSFSQFSINILPYTDLVTKLTEIYALSPEWNDYLKKTGDLHKATTLYDGSVVTEVSFDPALANTVLEKSSFFKEMQDMFLPYGYKVTSGGFPDEHQQILADEQLTALGKSTNLVVPVPNTTFILTKIK
jgi:hypothetical protein